MKWDLGMVCHTPPLEEARKQGGMPLPNACSVLSHP